MDEAKLKEWAQQRCVGTTLYWEYLVAHTRDLLAMQREEDAKVCEHEANAWIRTNCLPRLQSEYSQQACLACAAAIRKGKP